MSFMPDRAFRLDADRALDRDMALGESILYGQFGGTGEGLGLFDEPPAPKPQEAVAPPPDQFAPYAADPEPEDEAPADFPEEPSR